MSKSQIGCEEGPESPIQRVVHPGLGHALEEVVGMDETHGVSGADGGVAQGLSEESLVDAGGSQRGSPTADPVQFVAPIQWQWSRR